MARIFKAVSEWKKVLVVILASVLVLILADFILAFIFGSQTRSSAAFIFGSNDKATFTSLLFIEGGFIFGAGAFFASGISETKIAAQSNPASPYLMEKLSSQRPEHRKKQISTGVLLMLIGGSVLVISFILAFSFV
jgi:hypothetical protein